MLTFEGEPLPRGLDVPCGSVVKIHAPNAGGLGSISGQGTRSHMLQTGVHRPQLKILHAATKTQYSQINKHFLNGLNNHT